MKHSPLPHTVALCFLTACYLVFCSSGCRKADVYPSKQPYKVNEAFFRIPSHASNKLINLISVIRKSDSLNGFMPQITKRYGTPDWSNSIESLKESGYYENLASYPLNEDLSLSGTNALETGQQLIIPFRRIADGKILAFLFASETPTGFKFTFHKRRLLEVTDLSGKQDSLQQMARLAVFALFEKRINGLDSINLGPLYDSASIKGVQLKFGNSQLLSDRNNALSENGERLNDDGLMIYSITVCWRGTCPATMAPASMVTQIGVGTQLGSFVVPTGGGDCNYCVEKEAQWWNTPIGTGSGTSGTGTGADGTGGGSTGGGTSGGGYTCPATDWWCESGDYVVIDGMIYTPENYPAMEFGLPWLWWTNGYNNNIHDLPNLLQALGVNSRTALWIYRNPIITNQIITWLKADEYEDESLLAASMTIKAVMASRLEGIYDAYHYELFQTNFSPAILGVDAALYWINFKYQCALLRSENPDWSNLRIYYEASKEMVHLILDGAGMIPVIGEVFDLANGALYTIEGDGVNATLSYASMVPVAGWFVTPAKIAKRGLALANGTKTTLTWSRTGSSISFGSSKQLRKVLQLNKNMPVQAHHIIPWALRNDPLVQAAAKAKNPFHMNEITNGFPLHTSRHSGTHYNYTEKVKAAFQEISRQIGTNPDPDVAANELRRLAERIENAIRSQATIKIDEINF